MNLVPTLEEEEEYTIYAVNKLRKQYEKGISTQAKENPKAIWNYIKSKTNELVSGHSGPKSIRP